MVTTDQAAAGTGAAAGGGLVADAAEGNGLDIARQAAGDVLRGIFGGLPWEMSPSEIVDAVTPQFVDNLIGGGAADAAGQAAGVLVPYATELVGVMV